MVGIPMHMFDLVWVMFSYRVNLTESNIQNITI